jgi:hypothetical protein
MSHNLLSASDWYEPSRPHNPWERFTQLKEKNICAVYLKRLCPSTSTTSDVIKLFLLHDIHLLDDPVPRQRQRLKDFLNAVMSSTSSSSVTYLDDVQMHSKIDDIALLDDRNKHIRCAKTIGQPCDDCYIFSKNLTIPEFCVRLRDKVGDIK